MDGPLSHSIGCFLGVVLTCLIGKRLFDPWAGVFAALFLTMASEYYWLACRVNLDTVMTVFILASIYTIVLALMGDRHRVLWFRLAFLFSGLTTATKGPLRFIMPFLTLVVYLIIMRDFGTLKRVPWLSGFSVFLLIFLLGLGPACLIGGKVYTWELLFHQTLTRYVHGINHRKGFLFYFWSYPETLLPWVVFLPAALLFAIRKWKEPKNRSPLLFVLVWILANILFLSFSGRKCVPYALSVIPAGCLLIGFYMSAFMRGTRLFTTWIKIPVYLIGVLLVLSGIVLPFVPHIVQMRFPEITISRTPFILLAIGSILFGLIICFLLIICYINYFSGSRWILPIFNQVRSPRALGTEIQRLVDEGYDLRVFGGLEHPGILFYSRLRCNRRRKVYNAWLKRKDFETVNPPSGAKRNFSNLLFMV